MSTATLMIGFKFDSFAALKNHLKTAYFINNNLTKNPNFYTSNNSLDSDYKYKVFIGSQFENWYGWDNDQKRNAYLELWDRHKGFLRTACDWLNNKRLIRQMMCTTSHTPQYVIGIPLAEVIGDDNSTYDNNYNLIVSKNSDSDTSMTQDEKNRCINLQLTESQVEDFRTLVSYLKIQDKKPRFFMFNSNGATYFPLNPDIIWGNS